MSTPTWKQHIEKQLLEGNKCCEGIIINKVDGTPWGLSNENLAPRKMKDLVMQEDGSEKEEDIDEEVGLLEFVKTFKKPRVGFRLAGDKFQFLRQFEKGSQDDGIPTAVLKKPKGGACVCITEKALIIGLWEEGKNPQGASGCNDAVEKLARYLKQFKF